MPDKKYCYRYVDGNDSQGRAIVMLRERVILRETEKTFWYCPDYPHMSLEQIINYQSNSSNNQVNRCLKGAHRSRYHESREEALRAFIYRKQYQLSRIALTSETINLCLKGLVDTGFVLPDSSGSVDRFSEIISAPESEIRASEEPGLIASTYSWGDY